MKILTIILLVVAGMIAGAAIQFVAMYEESGLEFVDQGSTTGLLVAPDLGLEGQRASAETLASASSRVFCMGFNHFKNMVPGAPQVYDCTVSEDGSAINIFLVSAIDKEATFYIDVDD